jgi:hypothetical protein
MLKVIDSEKLSLITKHAFKAESDKKEEPQDLEDEKTYCRAGAQEKGPQRKATRRSWCLPEVLHRMQRKP